MENMNAKLCFFQLVMETVMPATNNSMAETELFTYEGKKVTINNLFVYFSEFFLLHFGTPTSFFLYV